MNDNIIQIELHATVLGEEYTIATYYSPVVPRKGEVILLRLHPGYQSVLPGGRREDHTCRFLVYEVTYVACNTQQTASWFTPWSAARISDHVVIDVVANDDEAKNYLNRLAGISNEGEK